MPKRDRVRARARQRLAAAPERAERPDRAQRLERDRSERRPRYRGAPLPAGGSHAIGEPSPTLERAAVVERGYVGKDLGRLGKVIIAMLLLLAASGVAVNTLVK